MKKLNNIQKLMIAIVMAFAVAVPVVIAQSTDGGQGSTKTERRAKRGGERGERRMHRGGDRFAGRMFRNLDLTDAQKTQMKQIRESHKEATRSLHEQIRAKRQEIRQANAGGSFNESLVSQKLAEIAPLEAKLMGERARIHQEMLAVLTPEQKAKMEQAREQFKTRSGERRARKERKTQ